MPRQRSERIETFVEKTASRMPGGANRASSPYQAARIAIEKCGAMQKKQELVDFLIYIKNRKPAQITEIGTARGGNLYAIAQEAHDYGQLISIDLPGGSGGGGYTLRDEYRIARRRKKGQQIHFIRGDSHNAGPEPTSTLSKLKDFLSDEKGRREIDLLYIDGDHSYSGVKQDFETYSRLVKRGGMIALHDIVAKPSGETNGGDPLQAETMAEKIEVPVFWNEIKGYFKHEEFIDRSEVDGPAGEAGGIGLIFDWQPARYDEYVLSSQPSQTVRQ